MAEGKGFEPLEACTSLVFKTSAFDHSAIPPAMTRLGRHGHSTVRGRKFGYFSGFQIEFLKVPIPGRVIPGADQSAGALIPLQIAQNILDICRLGI